MIDASAPGSRLVNAFYCSSITLTTVGYGDICPGPDTSLEGKVFLIALSFLGLGFFCGPVMDFASSWHSEVPGGPLGLAAVTLGLAVALFTQPALWDGKAGLTPLDAAYYGTYHLAYSCSPSFSGSLTLMRRSSLSLPQARLLALPSASATTPRRPTRARLPLPSTPSSQ
jgi:hypothetical protein